MSLIKLALDKNAGAIFNAVKGVGKAIAQTARNTKGKVINKVKGAAIGFEHGEMGAFATAQANKAAKAKTKLETATGLITGLRQKAEETGKLLHKKMNHLKIGAGAGIGLAGGLGYGIGKSEKKK